MPDDDLIADFMRREGVRIIPRGVTNHCLFDELPDRVRKRRHPLEIGKHLREVIAERFPRTIDGKSDPA